MKHIVVRAPNWLGDLVMALPLIRAIAELYPEAKLHLILKGSHALVLRMLPPEIQPRLWFFDKKTQRGTVGIWEFSRKIKREIQEEISLYFALPPSLSSALMGRLLGAKECVGYGSKGRIFFLNKTQPAPLDLHRAHKYFHLINLATSRKVDYPVWIPGHCRTSESPIPLPFRNYLVVNPNSMASSRRLPEPKWIELLSLFEGRNFVLTGTAHDYDRVEALTHLLRKKVPGNRYHNLAGETSIDDLIALLLGSKGMISNDSGPAHVAYFLGVPTLVFMGAGDPDSTGPFYGAGKAVVLREPLSCSPCLKNTCPLGTLQCLRELAFHPDKKKILQLFEEGSLKKREQSPV